MNGSVELREIIGGCTSRRWATSLPTVWRFGLNKLHCGREVHFRNTFFMWMYRDGCNMSCNTQAHREAMWQDVHIVERCVRRGGCPPCLGDDWPAGLLHTRVPWMQHVTLPCSAGAVPAGLQVLSGSLLVGRGKNWPPVQHRTERTSLVEN